MRKVLCACRELASLFDLASFEVTSLSLESTSFDDDGFDDALVAPFDQRHRKLALIESATDSRRWWWVATLTSTASGVSNARLRAICIIVLMDGRVIVPVRDKIIVGNCEIGFPERFSIERNGSIRFFSFATSPGFVTEVTRAAAEKYKSWDPWIEEPRCHPLTAIESAICELERTGYLRRSNIADLASVQLRRLTIKDKWVWVCTFRTTTMAANQFMSSGPSERIPIVVNINGEAVRPNAISVKDSVKLYDEEHTALD